MSNDYYNNQVREIALQYLSLSFDDVHKVWSHHVDSVLKQPNVSILDVGAGVGSLEKMVKPLGQVNHTSLMISTQTRHPWLIE